MNEFEWVAVALVAICSVARITRLITWDKWPPVVKLRLWWDGMDWTHRTGWNLLLHCGYCFSFWAMCAIVAWGYLTDWHTAWWLVNGVLGGSYLSAILMSNDGED